MTTALDAGWRVVCKKQLTIDVDGCRAIAEAARRSPAELQRHWERAREVPLQEDPSAHGGGDRLLVDDVSAAPRLTRWGAGPA